jgi:hypothetical protein
MGFVVALFAVLLTGTAFHFDTVNIGLRWENVFGGLPRVGFSFFAGVRFLSQMDQEIDHYRAAAFVWHRGCPWRAS